MLIVNQVCCCSLWVRYLTPRFDVFWFSIFMPPFSCQIPRGWFCEGPVLPGQEDGGRAGDCDRLLDQSYR